MANPQPDKYTKWSNEFMEKSIMYTNELKDLPKTMLERALYARNQAIKTPSLIQVDNNMLPWVYCEEDGLWYSFSGNYSHSSPEEKIKKMQDYEEKNNKRVMQMQEEAYLEYKENLKWSLIREDILDRDNFTCQLCGKNGNTKLHIHHILKRRKVKEDYYDRLITVCPKCHSQADRELYDPEWTE